VELTSIPTNAQEIFWQTDAKDLLELVRSGTIPPINPATNGHPQWFGEELVGLTINLAGILTSIRRPENAKSVVSISKREQNSKPPYLHSCTIVRDLQGNPTCTSYSIFQTC